MHPRHLAGPGDRTPRQPRPLPGPLTPFGVYLHIPFCAKRCDYCAFATWTDRHHLTSAYLRACRVEIERAVASGLPPATSVFVGGGTPSLVAPSELVEVLRAIPVAAGAEVTVECNPDTVTAALLECYVAGGVTRVSFGVQSMVDHVLAGLGRTHDPAAVARSVALARAVGIPTFNLDLIYGGAGESLADWRTTLERVIDLEPPHVSAYALTVEAGTPLAADASRRPDDDDQATKYELAAAMLDGAGLGWYEISNWARPAHECRHNLLYWEQGDYLGVGCAAHSHRAGRRWWNVRTPERYIACIERGEPAEAAGEALAADERRREALQLSLRTRRGVPAGELVLDGLDDLVDVGDDGRARLTVPGRLLANEVALRLR